MKRLVFVIMMTCSCCTMAMNWTDLWLRPDQQGLRLLTQGKAEQAAHVFQNSQWRGVALYRAGHYQQALQQFRQQDSAEARYNQANALALQGDYQTALDLYQAVLKMMPQHADAKYNYNIIQQLLQQQSAGKQTSKQQKQSRNNKQPDQATHQQQQQQQQQQASSQPASKPQKPEKNQPETDKNDENNKAAMNTELTATDTLKKQAGQIHKSITSSEKQQANEQWLRQIPDDPGGLLRQKFLRDYERMQ